MIKYFIFTILLCQLTFANGFAQVKEVDFMTYYSLAESFKSSKIDSVSCTPKSTKELSKYLNKTSWSIEEIDALECLKEASENPSENAFLNYVLGLAYSDFDFESKLKYLRLSYLDYSTLQDIEGQFYTLTRLFNSKMSSPDDSYSNDKEDIIKSFEEIKNLAQQSNELSVQLTLRESLIRKSFLVNEPLSEAELDDISKFAERHYTAYPTESNAVFTILGIAYQRAKLSEKALAYKRLSLKNADSTSNKYYEYFANMAGYHFYNKDLDSAYYNLKTSYDLIPKNTTNLEYLSNENIITYNLSQVLRRQGKMELAYDYLNKSYGALAVQYNVKLLNQRAFNEKQFELQKKEKELLEASAELQDEKEKIIYLALVVLFSGILIFFLYFNNKRIKQLKISADQLAQNREQLLVELKAEKEVIEEQAIQLQQLDRAKNDFFTNITHEFRTPLTLINGIIQLIEKNKGNTLEKDVEEIKQNSSKLLGMINQILDLRKLESNELTLQKVQTDVVVLIDSLIDSYQYLATKKQVNLEFKTTEQKVMMDIDPEKFQIVITNLLSNALKFTPEGGNVKIILRKNPSKQNIEIQVEDNGIGIQESELEQVFDRFYQAKNNTLISESGTGIGLYNTKQLIQLMQGEIHLKSKPQEGTTVMLGIPITLNEDIKVINFEKGKVENEEVQIGDSTSKRKKPKETETILVVDDNYSIRELISQQLQGYNILMAKDGEEGIEKALKEVPDLIVSDVMMPKKDGFELCKILKKNKATSHIPIILLTAKAEQESKIDGLKAKADDYIYKPYDLEELQLKIKNHIESRRQLRETFRNLKTGSLPTSYPNEDKFILDLRALILSHLKDMEYGIADICKALKISRAQLHNKVKALTGLSTSNYINYVKLTKAKEMLEQSDLNINEIGYAIGEGNQSYFSKKFKQEFGVSPIMYRESLTKK